MPTPPRMKADCHAHVIDPACFPYAEGPGYKPHAGETGDRAAFFAALADNGVDCGLLVQPSCYGFDNAAMLDAIAASRGRLKGIGVVEAGIAHQDMLALRRQGVVGARLNIGSFDPDFFRRAEAAPFLERCADVGWFVEVYAIGDAWVPIAPVLASAGAKVIVDHMGHPDPAAGLDQPGFQAVLSLASRHDALVKLSSFFRVSREPWPHADVEPFARETLQAFGTERCIWGSDWPFIDTPRTARYGEQLDCLTRWLPDAGDREAVLWRNPARLFGFGANGHATH